MLLSRLNFFKFLLFVFLGFELWFVPRIAQASDWMVMESEEDCLLMTTEKKEG